MAETTVEIAVKPELITFGVFEVKTADGFESDGTTPRYKTEIKAASREKTIEAAKKDGTLLFEQSISYDVPATIAGILQVIKDEEEALAVFKSGGLSTRLNSRITAMLTEVDEQGNAVFQPVEGSWDARDLLNEAAQKRNLSPIEKATKALAATGLPPEVVAALIAQARESMIAQTVTAAE